MSPRVWDLQAFEGRGIFGSRVWGLRVDLGLTTCCDRVQGTFVGPRSELLIPYPRQNETPSPKP